EVSSSDTIEAWADGCGAGNDMDALLIDPAGVGFDSSTNEEIAGATVRLIDVTGAGNGGIAGGDAAVFAFDTTTRWPATVVSDSDGRFQFPLVPPGVYRLGILRPDR